VTVDSGGLLRDGNGFEPLDHRHGDRDVHVGSFIRLPITIPMIVLQHEDRASGIVLLTQESIEHLLELDRLRFFIGVREFRVDPAPFQQGFTRHLQRLRKPLEVGGEATHRMIDDRAALLVPIAHDEGLAERRASLFEIREESRRAGGIILGGTPDGMFLDGMARGRRRLPARLQEDSSHNTPRPPCGERGCAFA